MPLTSKGKTVLKNMKKTYGSEKKAKEVFYSSINKKKKGSKKWHSSDRSNNDRGRQNYISG